MAYLRAVEQPYRKKIACATSRGGRGQFHDQNQSQAWPQIVGGRTQVLHSCTTVAQLVVRPSRPVVRPVVLSHDR